MTTYIDWKSRVAALRDGLKDPDLVDVERRIGRRYLDELEAAGGAYEATVNVIARTTVNDAAHEAWAAAFDRFTRAKVPQTLAFCDRATRAGAEALDFEPAEGFDNWGKLYDGAGGYVDPSDGERGIYRARFTKLRGLPGFQSEPFCLDVVIPAELALQSLPYDPGPEPPHAEPITTFSVTIKPGSEDAHATASAELAAVIEKVDPFLELEELA